MAAVSAPERDLDWQLKNGQVEAAVVRIMKSRKQLEHNTLVAEVTTQLTHSKQKELAATQHHNESQVYPENRAAVSAHACPSAD